MAIEGEGVDVVGGAGEGKVNYYVRIEILRGVELTVAVESSGSGSGQSTVGSL